MIVDPAALARDTSRLVQVPSLTGHEREAVELAAAIGRELGLEAEVHEHDLAALRAHPGHPGEEAPRTELVSATVTRRGSSGRRLALNGHVDVVHPGSVEWEHGPWSGLVEGGCVHGRGSIDMKGGVAAALHAMAAAGGDCEVVLQVVPSEEDGGLGTFAALEHDDRFDACLIPEPTAFRVICAHGGALTFKGVIHGRAVHAAFRLDGDSALDRYIPVHQALQALEAEMNTDVEHPLMRTLELPYPLVVGQLRAGRWSSIVPDRLVFEGRVGVPVGTPVEEVRERVAAAAGPDVELTWTGGQFAPAETAADHPFTQLVAEVTGAELAGVPYGADMRLYTERGIPAVMYGPGGLALVHAVDERVPVDELVATATAIAGVIERF